MFDFHVHTHYSNDCTFDMDSYIHPAIKKGLKGICFTDHVDIEYPNSSIEFELDYAKYTNEIKRLKDKYSSKLEIFTGIEFGMQPHILEADEVFFQNKSFDYILGSIHTANKKELYGGDFLLGQSEHDSILNYFNDMIFCVNHFNSYHNLGHLDAISRYVSSGSFKSAKYMEFIEEVLRIIVQKGKGIELNTSGRRYSLPHFHPEPSIIKLYNQLGGEIVTLGSDSHSPSTLGFGFDEAVATLQSCGLKYYTIYKGGKPEFIKL
ncbi:MAG TPA: histidinol-phosphatase HisJ family protein [Patescibacteria group bacterium]|nr:histidinol-phosphatase HisJ family protein [Patescibacteria group bacterium]